MKAAAVLAERGHEVTLYEADAPARRPGAAGAASARRAPNSAASSPIWRARWSWRASKVRRNAPGRSRACRSSTPDAVVIATGAKPHWPAFEGRDDSALRRCLAGVARQRQCRLIRRHRRLAGRLDRHGACRKTCAGRLPRPALRERADGRAKPSPGMCATDWSANCTSSASRSSLMRGSSAPTADRLHAARDERRADHSRQGRHPCLVPRP